MSNIDTGTMSIESLSKQLLSKAIAGTLTHDDYLLWIDHGHLCVHWLRKQFERMMYNETGQNINRTGNRIRKAKRK